LLGAGKDPSQVKQDRKREDKRRYGLTFASLAAACFGKTKKEGWADAMFIKTSWVLDMAIADFGAKPTVNRHAKLPPYLRPESTPLCVVEIKA
jgi:hypothetical protein